MIIFIIFEHQSTQNLLKRLLEEAKLGSNNAKKKKILPQNPFAEAHDFAAFEDKIKTSETKFNDLVNSLP